MFVSCCGGVCVFAASASVSYLLRASRVITWLPRDFTRFCNACARAWAVEPSFAVVSTSFSRFVCTACSLYNELSASTYSLHFALYWLVMLFTVVVQAASMLSNLVFTAASMLSNLVLTAAWLVLRYSSMAFTERMSSSRSCLVACVSP